MKRVVAQLILVMLLLSGCLGSGMDRGPGPNEAKGILAFTVSVAGEDEFGVLSAPPRIDNYKIHLKGAQKSFVEEFAASETAIAVELDAGFWEIQVEALDPEGVVRFASQPETVEIVADSTTTTEVVLHPADATLHVKVDASNLYHAGFDPEVVDIYIEGSMESIVQSLGVDWREPIAITDFAVQTPQTIDLLLEVKSKDGRVLARQVMIGIDVHPGETAEIAWAADPPQQGEGALGIKGALLRPLDPPEIVDVTWNPISHQFDLFMSGPEMPPGGIGQYVLEVQEAVDQPFSQIGVVGVSAGEASFSLEIPTWWYGTTKGFRASAEWSEGGARQRRSVASMPIEVVVPRIREQVIHAVEWFIRGLNEKDGTIMAGLLTKRVRLKVVSADPELEPDETEVVTAEFVEGIVGSPPALYIPGHFEAETNEDGYRVTGALEMYYDGELSGEGILSFDLVRDGVAWRIAGIITREPAVEQ